MKNILNNINKLTENIEYNSQLIGRNQRLSSGVSVTRFMGIIIGFIITIIFIAIPIFMIKGGL